MILVTFDESENGAESCCGETDGPNTPNNGGLTKGSGGGKVGAVMVSPCIEPGTVSDSDYNHYSMLRWVEDNFGLGHLANAAPAGLRPFGGDILNRPSCDLRRPITAAARMQLRVRPRRAPVGRRLLFHFRFTTALEACRAGATIRFAGHRVKVGPTGRARVRARLSGRQRAVVAALTSPTCGAASARVRALAPERRRHGRRAPPG